MKNAAKISNEENKQSTLVLDKHFPYYARELSWLDFNARVLEEAAKKNNPILERFRFLGITASNLDEFFMVRIPYILHKINSNYDIVDYSGLTAVEEFSSVVKKVHDFVNRQYSCLHRSIMPALKKVGMSFVTPSKFTDKQKKFIDKYYQQVVFPVLTPLAVDTSRPFPLLSNKSLNIAVRLYSTSFKGAEPTENFALIQVPSILPRFIELPKNSGHRQFVMLEDVIIEKLNSLFEFHEIKSASPFRITRDSDLDIDEEGDDLLEEVQKSIKKRKRGMPVRLEIIKKCDPRTKAFLVEALEISKKEIYEVSGPIDLTFFTNFANISKGKKYCFEPIKPVYPAADFWGYDDMFKAIREKDRMVHHPYESFETVVKFIQRAAEDKNVLAIKQTLYRVSENSPIITALIRAAEKGKQVTVLVELKARFDEENNIQWAKKLERAGCHVIYGLMHLKTHCKILLVVRKEKSGIRRYLHLGTGNYNESTAKIYTDIGLFTCDDQFGMDASSFFNFLTGYFRPVEYNKFVIAPTGMRSFFENAIRKETQNAKAGLPSGITVKINSLVDPIIIKLLYDASNAGVKINLIVRGICCLVPGIKGISENIKVVSIVGQLLEHSRIFKFESAGNPIVYMGSADWMPRNLNRRVELIFPIEDLELKKRAFDMLDLMLKDNTNARIEQSDTTYMSVDKRGKKIVSSQRAFSQMAQKALKDKKDFQRNDLFR